MEYSKETYNAEKQARYVNVRDEFDSCGHVENGWCGVCYGAQPSFVKRNFTRVN